MKAPTFLSHLRTDDRGRPVPFINLWGTEDVSRMSIRHDPHVDMPAVYLDDEGQAVPDFTRQSMQRQRECMVRGLCQVCGVEVPWLHRLLVVSRISLQHITLRGRVVPTLTEPWLDPQCAEFALTKCPGLIRRRTADDLQLVAVTSPSQCSLTISTGWMDGPLEAESKRVQPAMWVKVLLGGFVRSSS